MCAGAGLSNAAPTSLPLGSELAAIVHGELATRLGEAALAGTDVRELLSVADRVEALDGGSALLQSALMDAAPYTTAEPNYGHRVLALLLLDGAIEVVLTNYDNCIEREAGLHGRVEAVVSDADRAQVRGAAVLKVHGCATRAGTMLASSQQLETPPTWVFHYLGERLGSSSVVFLGLGDVADYVRIRIRQLLDGVGDADRIWVAATTLSEVWEELVPDIETRFIQMGADEFLDELIRDYVRVAFRRVEQDARLHRDAGTYEAQAIDPTRGTQQLAEALLAAEAAGIVGWLRAAALRWPSGETVVQSTAVRETLLALALVGASRQLIFDGRRFAVGADRVELLFARSLVASAIAEAAQVRVARRRATGEVGIHETVTVMCHGHQGPLPTQMPVDVIPGETPEDIIDGPNVPLVRLVWPLSKMPRQLGLAW